MFVQKVTREFVASKSLTLAALFLASCNSSAKIRPQLCLGVGPGLMICPVCGYRDLRGLAGDLSPAELHAVEMPIADPRWCFVPQPSGCLSPFPQPHVHVRHFQGLA